MVFSPGQSGNPGGKPRGTINSTTKNAREAIAAFVENNAERLQELVTSIEKEDGPKAAFDCFMQLIEYHIPKLQRHENINTSHLLIAPMTAEAQAIALESMRKSVRMELEMEQKAKQIEGTVIDV